MKWITPTYRCLLAIIGLFAVSMMAHASKAEGPFAIAAKITGHHVTITITSPVAAKNLELHLYGSDGLEVAGAVPSGPLKVKEIKRESLAKGEMWTEEADFTQPAGMSYLNIWVGSSGQPSVVRFFSVGELSDAQKAERNKGVRLDPDGKPIRLSE